MRKPAARRVFALRSGIFLPALLSCLLAPAAWAQSLAPTDEVRYGHLEYFGFYASALGHWNFTTELAPYTNLTWIHVGSADYPENAIEQMVQRLQQAADAGVAAVLSIEPFLFANEEGDLRPEDEVEDFLQALRSQIETASLLDTLVMIYPKDEPFREFVSARNPSFIEEYVTGDVYEDVHAVLTVTNQRIRAVFPEKPIGVILSGYRLHHDFFSIPDTFDWVGFDCYKDLFDSCDDETFDRHYEQLIAHMHGGQRLMAVAETWAENDRLGQSGWPDTLYRRLMHHYEMALSDPRFVAFIPFIWSFESESEVPGVGLDRFGELFDEGNDAIGSAFTELVLDIGLQVKTRQYDYPNLHHSETEDSPNRPPSNVRGELVAFDKSGLVTAWALDDGLPYKNLRVQLRVRDLRGQLLYKSRTERTFLASASWPGLGTHVYRHRVPGDVLRRFPARQLQVELVVFADGQPRGTKLTLHLSNPEKGRINSRL